MADPLDVVQAARQVHGASSDLVGPHVQPDDVTRRRGYRHGHPRPAGGTAFDGVELAQVSGSGELGGDPGDGPVSQS